MTVYGIPDFRKAKNPTETFCSLVGRVKGKVGKGGVPDKIESARGIIKDWNDGLIKFYSVPPEEDLGKEEVAKVRPRRGRRASMRVRSGANLMNMQVAFEWISLGVESAPGG